MASKYIKIKSHIGGLSENFVFLGPTFMSVANLSRKEENMKATKYVQLEKQSKKAQKEFYKSQRSESFGMSMITKVDKDRSKYDRNACKRETRQYL